MKRERRSGEGRNEREGKGEKSEKRRGREKSRGRKERRKGAGSGREWGEGSGEEREVSPQPSSDSPKSFRASRRIRSRRSRVPATAGRERQGRGRCASPAAARLQLRPPRPAGSAAPSGARRSGVAPAPRRCRGGGTRGVPVPPPLARTHGGRRLLRQFALPALIAAAAARRAAQQITAVPAPEPPRARVRPPPPTPPAPPPG